MIKKYVICFYLLSITPVFAAELTLKTVLSQYEVALSDLIKAHQATTPTQPILLESGSIIFATYQKIIAPYITYIKGYANVVQSEWVSNLPYHDDLKKLSQEFVKNQKEVRRIAQYFPEAQQQAVIQAFYLEIGASVVQICFNIVQKTSYALTVDPGVLASCFLAYQLALEIYVSSMTISGVATGSSVPEMLADAMITLYQAAIVQRQNELSTGLSHAGKVQALYQEIEAYYKILSTVYMYAGNGAQSSNMLEQVQTVQTQATAWAQAESVYKQAVALAVKARAVIILDPLQSTQLATTIAAQQQQSITAYQLLQKAQTAYQTASDPIGQQECTQAISMITNIDMIVRFLGQLWSLYLTDQSSNNVMTAPTIALFIQSGTSGSATLQDFEQALQNLIDFLSQSSNSVNQLATQAQLQQYSVTAIVNLLEQNILSASSVTTAIDPLVSLAAVQQAQLVVQCLQSMSQAILNACSATGSKTNSIALAMTYASEMDTLFTGKDRKMLESLVPYFPDQLKQGATWTDWVAALLVSAQVVSTKALAYAQIGKAKITKPVTAASSINVAKATAQAQLLESSASVAAHAGNFAGATTDYQQAFTAYQSLYGAQSQSALVTTWYQKAMLMRTLFSASSFASVVQPVGSVTWKTVAGIPTSYIATQYQFSQISMADFGGVVLPASLQSLAVGAVITTLTTAQQKDIFALLQAYMVNQILTIQGINFTDCFVDYTMSIKQGIDATAAGYAKQAIDQVQTAVSFKDSAIVSLTLQDASMISSVNCRDIPLNAVTPLYSTMATGITFLASAFTLFAAGTTDISLGGTQYVPGNQPVIAQAILHEMVDAYLSQGYLHYQQAKTLMASVISQLPKGKKVVQQNLPANFSDTFSLVNKNITRAQAMLYAPEQSAYAYAQQSTDATLSTAVQGLFLDMYDEMVTWMKQCLVGNPFSANYQMLLHQINMAYMNWASTLSATKDAAQINAFNVDMAQLFENAGKLCMQTSYTQPEYPGYNQMHYATAAHYLLAAQKKYAALGQTTKADDMTALAHTAYYNGANQNISLYFHVKQQGLFYISDETNKLVPITVAQMAQDSASGFVDGGEQDAYNSVKNLLLNAGMSYEFLGNGNSKSKTKVKPAATLPVTATAKAKQQPPSKLIIYLRKKNIIDSTALEIPYYQQGIVEKLFAITADAYQQFLKDPVTLEAWMNTLLLAVQSLYAQDYMGVVGEQTGAQVAQQAQAFFQALQKESSSLENPSSAYVG